MSHESVCRKPEALAAVEEGGGKVWRTSEVDMDVASEDVANRVSTWLQRSVEAADLGTGQPGDSSAQVARSSCRFCVSRNGWSTHGASRTTLEPQLPSPDQQSRRVRGCRDLAVSSLIRPLIGTLAFTREGASLAPAVEA